MTTVNSIKKELRQFASPEQAKILQRFFKTGPGQYGEGDIFIGVKVPNIRKVAKKFFKEASPEVVSALISSPIHEERLCAILILVHQYEKGDEQKKASIFDLYMANLAGINNWDLVDLSADKIVGKYLEKRDRSLLYDFAKSDNLWERRIAVITTFHFIRQNDFTDTVKLSELLLNDSHDLMHKACGWMLREVGNRDQSVLIKFLDRHCTKMPRTMLRYAMEKLPKDVYYDYLHVKSKEVK